MDQKQIEEAVDYNKRRGYSTAEVKLAQRTIGAAEDGRWGPQTVTKIYCWQNHNGLVADGKLGPKTWAAIQTSWEQRPVPAPEQPVQVGCGLAAYDQSWPGHTPEEAMQLAWDTALSLGCKELRFWSSEWLIDDIGNKGNGYSGPWLTVQRAPAGVVVGVWIDDPVKAARTEAFADRLVSMGVGSAALMINKSNTRKSDVPWSLRWDREALKKVARLYRGRGIDVVCTTWPRPSRSQIDAMCEDMAWVLGVTESVAFEVDTEGNWTRKFLEGFASMKEASEYLAVRMRQTATDDRSLELTTYTYHPENSSKATLAPLMDRLLPQAYSVRHRGNETVSWGDALGPGNHQKLAIGRARQAAGA